MKKKIYIKGKLLNSALNKALNACCIFVCCGMVYAYLLILSEYQSNPVSCELFLSFLKEII